jgi:serine/threonine protein kinase
MNELGQGTHGRVFREKRGGKFVAIKEFKYEHVSWIEFDILNTYSHPNIIRLISTITKSDGKIKAPALVMEMGSPIEAVTPSIIHDLCFGLAFLHSKGVLHLDLKRDNVVFAEGKAKWIDFGFSVQGTHARIKKGYYAAWEFATTLHRPPEAALENIQTRKTGIKSFISTKFDVFGLGWTLVTLFDETYHSPSIGQYELMRKEMENDEIDKAFYDNHESKAYYFHLLFTKDEEQRFILLDRIVPKNFEKRDFYINLIHSMLSWDPNDRPEMENVIETFSVPIPKGITKINLGDGTGDMGRLKNYLDLVSSLIKSIDAIYVFMIIDMYCRMKNGNDHDLLMATTYIGDFAKKDTDGLWLSDDGKYERISQFAKYLSSVDMDIDTLVQLDGSMTCCNLLYRMCNSVEALVDNLRRLLDGDISYAKTDFYKLKEENEERFENGDKTMAFSELYKAL